ncbi:MAG: radical SAM protein [Candidatus Muiribacteriota bacterium]
MNICLIRFSSKIYFRDNPPPFMLEFLKFCLNKNNIEVFIYDMWIKQREPDFSNYTHFIIECPSYEYNALIKYAKENLEGKKMYSIGNFKPENNIFLNHFKPFDTIIPLETFQCREPYRNYFADWNGYYSNPEKYYFLYPLKEISKVNWTFIPTGIGCPGKCRFCSGNIRKSAVSPIINRPVEKIINNILSIKKKQKFVVFEDDNFFRDKNFTLTLLNEIIKRKIIIKWSAQVRADTICDKNTLDIIKNSGCVLLRIGAESFDAETLKYCNKGKKYSIYLNKCVKLLNKKKIPFVLLTISGLPQDLKTGYIKTLFNCLKSDAFIVQLHNFVPYEDSFFGKKFGVDFNSYHYSFKNKNYANYSNFFQITLFFIFYTLFFMKKLFNGDLYLYIRFFLKNRKNYFIFL